MANWHIAPTSDDLIHYGVLGMKWGIRRYQNADGSLTSEGKKRYNEAVIKEKKSIDDNLNYLSKNNKNFVNLYNRAVNEQNKIVNKYNEEYDKRYANVPVNERYRAERYAKVYNTIFNNIFHDETIKSFKSLYPSKMKDIKEFVEEFGEKNLDKDAKKAYSEVIESMSDKNYQDYVSAKYLYKLWDEVDKTK